MQMIRKLEYDINLQKILLKVDRASMYNSLEVRVPLLGNEIIDFSTSINYDRCIYNDKGKIPLRNTLKKYINSNSLINEKKMGFTIPIDRWRTSLKDEIIEKIYDMPSGLAGIINQAQAKKLINEHMNETGNWGWMAWSIYSLIRWYDYHRN